MRRLNDLKATLLPSACAGLLAGVASLAAQAQAHMPKQASMPMYTPVQLGPPHPPDCITAAAQHHQVSPYVLRAIAWQESRLNPEAMNRNANGSVDYGAMQINSIHLKRLGAFGIDAQRLMDPCVSAFVGAWLLREQFDRYGTTWQAVGAYHSRTPALNARYSAGVRRTLERWGVRMGLDD